MIRILGKKWHLFLAGCCSAVLVLGDPEQAHLEHAMCLALGHLHGQVEFRIGAGSSNLTRENWKMLGPWYFVDELPKSIWANSFCVCKEHFFAPATCAKGLQVPTFMPQVSGQGEGMMPSLFDPWSDYMRENWPIASNMETPESGFGMWHFLVRLILSSPSHVGWTKTNTMYI